MRTALNNVRGKLVCAALIVVLFLYSINIKNLSQKKDTHKELEQSKISEIHEELDSFRNLISDKPLWDQTLDFDQLNFSNETGSPFGCYLVPNYIHYVYLGGTPIDYINLICILAAFKNQNPEKIFFHHNDKNVFTGKYWEVLKNTPGLNDIIVFHEVTAPEEVFGQPLSEDWRNWHGSDLVRIQMIMKYGGIFLDNDCYLIKNINDFRKYEVTVNWDEDQFLGNQVIVAHKDARFLRKWFDTYKVYDKTKWYYNGGERPTVEVLYKQPELIHRVKVLFGADIKYVFSIFQQQWADWKSLYIVHLLSRHQYLLKSINENAKYPVTFNESNISYYPITFREMAYEVYDIANIKWPKDRF